MSYTLTGRGRLRAGDNATSRNERSRVTILTVPDERTTVFADAVAMAVERPGGVRPQDDLK
jgi:hypothetical protein